MDIQRILCPPRQQRQIQRLFDSFDCKDEDLIYLVRQCQQKLTLYDQIKQKKHKLLDDYQQIKQKMQNISPGSFQAYQIEYKKSKIEQKKESLQKNQSATKKSATIEKNNHHSNNNQFNHTKQIKKIDKRRK